MNLDRRAALGLLGSGLASACSPGPYNAIPPLRFRLIIELLTRQGVERGSSVRQVSYSQDPSWFPSDGAGQPKWEGEPTPVSLGGGAWLFAMLEAWTVFDGERQRSRGPWNPYSVLQARMYSGDPAVKARYDALSASRDITQGELLRGLLGSEPLVLAPDELPILIAFSTPEIPRSGQLVLPENLTSTFPGVSWGRCTVQATEAPLSFGQSAAILPWLNGEEVMALRTTDPFAVNFNTLEFERR